MQPFEGEIYPEAEAWLQDVIQINVSHNSFALKLQEELLEKTSTTLFEWIDFVVVPEAISPEGLLQNMGFVLQKSPSTYRYFSHVAGKLPSIVIRKQGCPFPLGLALKVESIADFLMVRGLSKIIVGSLFSPFRFANVHEEEGISFLIIERRGSKEIESKYPSSEYLVHTVELIEKWKTRTRSNFAEAFALAEECVQKLGKGAAAHLVLAVERAYWQARNTVAQVQKGRQDALGLGWGNHDHHSFWSSRRSFVQLVRLFEVLGFTCRERFYAKETSSGVQIMEHPEEDLILSLEVDLVPEEAALDFAHQRLEEKQTLGVVGLWCALHGDSIQEAGMHHLGVRVDLGAFKEELQQYALEMEMSVNRAPYLICALPQGEVWKVPLERLKELRDTTLITEKMAEQIYLEGAEGSHLESLQREAGYRGF